MSPTEPVGPAATTTGASATPLSATPTVPLTRASAGCPDPAPVRIVHLGLGNFFRAHQAWYTQHAPDTEQWGIAAFAGRSAGITADLLAQDGLYTLLVRAREGDQPEVIATLSAIHAGTDLAALRGYLTDPQVAIVTSTITEAGYLRDASGGLDFARAEVAADRDALLADPVTATVTTAPGKLVAGLLARRTAGAGPITLLPCDNIPENGQMLARVVADMAAAVDPTLVQWIEANVSFATSMVDRITPRPTEDDRAALAAASGVDDRACVVTEPFAEWVISGEFPAGRPAWDAAGARFVADIVPFETRKLWLLNGSHSLMAYAAGLRGHATVYDAIADPVVRDWVEQWWDVAARNLPLPEQEIASYRAALIERYGNPNIRHLLAQIASDGSQKIPIRIVPALLADRAAGRVPTGATRAIAAWIAHLRGHGVPVTDPTGTAVRELAYGAPSVAVPAVLDWLGIHDEVITELVLAQYDDLVGA